MTKLCDLKTWHDVEIAAEGAERRIVYDLAACPAWYQYGPEYGPECMPHDGAGTTDPEARVAWSGDGAPPAIGDTVQVKFNGLGGGTVVAYFVEYGYLGVQVKLDKEPAWHRKQTAGTGFAGCALVFGLEIATGSNG